MTRLRLGFALSTTTSLVLWVVVILGQIGQDDAAFAVSVVALALSVAVLMSIVLPEGDDR